MSSDQLERLLTQEEVADSLQVKTRTLHAWRKNGKGPRVTRVGPLIRYRPQDVREWINQQAEGDQR